MLLRVATVKKQNKNKNEQTNNNHDDRNKKHGHQDAAYRSFTYLDNVCL